MPGDNLVLIGTDEQLAAAGAALQQLPAESGTPTPERCEMKLLKYRVLPRSPLIGRTIRSSGIREEGSALVTGLERDARRIPNPDGATIIQQDHLQWLVGDADKVRRFMHNGTAVRE